jgi:hypothetical protein
MKKALVVVLAVGLLAAAPAYAALTSYVGRGTQDRAFRISFKLSSTKVRAIDLNNLLYRCTGQPNFRAGVGLPPLNIRRDRTFVFRASQDFGDHFGVIQFKGRVLRGGNVAGYVKERRAYDDGSVCKTGFQPFRAHPRR